jgi:hypothetical protein
VDTSSSPLCRVIWTDIAGGSSHLVFGDRQPIELRFGLQFDPSFWSSFGSSSFFAFFAVYRFGSLRNRHQQNGGAMSLPGAGSTELWLGLSLGRATQAIDDGSGGSGSGTYQFRPQIFFLRGDAPSEFAVAPNDCSFMLDPFIGGDGFTSEQLVGGPGHPGS